MNHEILAVLEYIEQERSISKEQLVSAVEKSLAATCQRNPDCKAKYVEAKLNRTNGSIRVTATYEVVETVQVSMDKDKDKSDEQISLADAQKVDPSVKIGDKITIEITPRNLGRVVAQSAKQAILQEIRKAEKQTIEDEFRGLVGEIVSGTVKRFDQGNIYVELQKAEAVIPAKEKVPGEMYMPGDRINALLLRIANRDKDSRNMDFLKEITKCKFHFQTILLIKNYSDLFFHLSL